MAFTIDHQSIQLMGAFEQITRAKVKDAFEDNRGWQIFVVNKGEKRKAIGPKAANVKRLEKKLNKRVKIIEFVEDIEAFVKDVVYPNECGIIVKNETVTLVPHDLKVRGQLIGRAAAHLRNTEMIVQRYFPVKRMMVTQVQETQSWETNHQD